MELFTISVRDSITCMTRQWFIIITFSLTVGNIEDLVHFLKVNLYPHDRIICNEFFSKVDFEGFFFSPGRSLLLHLSPLITFNNSEAFSPNFFLEQSTTVKKRSIKRQPASKWSFWKLNDPHLKRLPLHYLSHLKNDIVIETRYRVCHYLQCTLPCSNSLWAESQLIQLSSAPSFEVEILSLTKIKLEEIFCAIKRWNTHIVILP